ncbi:MAG: hypothetical protein ACFB51_13865 [Anaerolineae bacterium]
MALELPALSAVVARLPNPEINLAAYGGVVFPLALIIESPIIMLLAASTALSKDWDSYIKLRRFMVRTSVILTVLHLTITLPPLYFVVVEGIIGAPPEIVGPARIGMLLMTPWTPSIANRRFHQGILIRFDRSWAVGVGTAIRLLANGSVLVVGLLVQTIPGIIVATLAISAGVISEAIFSSLIARPIIRGPLKEAPLPETLLTFDAFLAFYLPLAATSLINLLNQPIGSAALSRMPFALESLAIWPVINGIMFIFRSPGFAMNEVVVALFEEKGAIYALRRVVIGLAVLVTGLMLLMAVTPLARFWFRDISALAPNLAQIATGAFWLALPMPLFSMLRNYYQGIIVSSKRTRAVTEAVAIYLVSIIIGLGAGVAVNTVTGLFVGVAVFSLAEGLQVIWLAWRSRHARAQARAESAP